MSNTISILTGAQQTVLLMIWDRTRPLSKHVTTFSVFIPCHASTLCILTLLSVLYAVYILFLHVNVLLWFESVCVCFFGGKYVKKCVMCRFMTKLTFSSIMMFFSVLSTVNI